MTKFQYALIGLGLVAVGLFGCVMGDEVGSMAASIMGLISAASGLVIVLS